MALKCHPKTIKIIKIKTEKVKINKIIIRAENDTKIKF